MLIFFWLWSGFLFQIRIYDGSDNVVFTSHYKEKPLHADDENPNFVHAFNAYTPAGEMN